MEHILHYPCVEDERKVETMKKILSCLLAVLLLVSVCAMAFADEEVPSVEPDKGVPTVTDGTDADGNDVTDAIVITDYADKDTLPEEAQEKLDAAFDALQDLEALAEGNEELKALLDEGDADCEALFDISVTGDVAFPVKLSLELLNPDNFAALLHFVDGEASVVDAELEDAILTFTLEEIGSYAVLSFVEE
jgi:hypothetical protein